MLQQDESDLFRSFMVDTIKSLIVRGWQDTCNTNRFVHNIIIISPLPSKPWFVRGQNAAI